MTINYNKDKGFGYDTGCDFLGKIDDKYYIFEVRIKSTGNNNISMLFVMPNTGGAKGGKLLP